MQLKQFNTYTCNLVIALNVMYIKQTQARVHEQIKEHG